MIISGSSLRGLSLESTTTSLSRPAASPISGRLAAVAFAAAAEKRDDAAGGMQFARRLQQLLQGVVGVRVIHHHHEGLPQIDALEAAGHRVQFAQCRLRSLRAGSPERCPRQSPRARYRRCCVPPAASALGSFPSASRPRNPSLADVEWKFLGGDLGPGTEAIGERLRRRHRGVLRRKDRRYSRRHRARGPRRCLQTGGAWRRNSSPWCCENRDDRGSDW